MYIRVQTWRMYCNVKIIANFQHRPLHTNAIFTLAQQLPTTHTHTRFYVDIRWRQCVLRAEPLESLFVTRRPRKMSSARDIFIIIFFFSFTTIRIMMCVCIQHDYEIREPCSRKLLRGLQKNNFNKKIKKKIVGFLHTIQKFHRAPSFNPQRNHHD